MNRGGDHFVGPFKSFWVSRASQIDFEADIVINPTSDRGRGLPLKLNQCQSIGDGKDDKAESACVEFETAQPGVWIDITFAQEDRIDVGSVVIDLSGEVAIIDGVGYESEKVSLPNTTLTMILPADDTRIVSSLQCKSGGVFWIGKGTAAELSHADFKNICHKVVLAVDQTFEWKNKSALYAYTDAGASVFSHLLEKSTV